VLLLFEAKSTGSKMRNHHDPLSVLWVAYECAQHGLIKPLLLTLFGAISLVSAYGSRVSYVSLPEGRRRLLNRR